jgi:hypothetical protein
MKNKVETSRFASNFLLMAQLLFDACQAVRTSQLGPLPPKFKREMQCPDCLRRVKCFETACTFFLQEYFLIHSVQ